MPLHGGTGCIAPSLNSHYSESRNGTVAIRNRSKFRNPTVLPREILSNFQFTFLIRSPRQSIPSLYECCIPPKSFVTEFHGFLAADAGYEELRRLFDYLVTIKQIGPNTENEICIVDAEDLLEFPKEIMERFCHSVEIPFDFKSLEWGTEKDQKRAEDVFKNWAPFYDAVLKSTSLKSQRPVSLVHLIFCLKSDLRKSPLQKLTLLSDYKIWRGSCGIDSKKPR